jgi:Mor family transcriptional regulator
MNKFEEKNSAGFLSELTAKIANRLRKRMAISEDAALDVALDVADDIRTLWGGVSVYIANTDSAALTAKYDAIWEAYKAEGFSLSLIQRFELSEQRIRQIIHRKRRENKLPGEAQPLSFGSIG